MLNPAFITAVDLLEYFVDRDTGLPLSGGFISFYEDDSRTTPKPVYELVYTPPNNYSYVALPNPIQLSATGTIVDNSGAQVALYYYPYEGTPPSDPADEVGPLQLYYIEVTNSLGVPQFSRSAWPNVTDVTSPINGLDTTIYNLLANPQFAQVLFNGSLSIPYTGSGTVTTTIAPGWDLVFTFSDAIDQSVVVTQNPIAGSAGVVTNPPFTLIVTPGSKITTIYLRQRLYGNPGIWTENPNLDEYFVVTNVTLQNNVGTTIMYQPSMGTPQTLFNYTNREGLYWEISQCVQLTQSDNAQTGASGYVDIQVVLSNSAVSELTSLQVSFLRDRISDNVVTFVETPVNRQISDLFYYYQPQLDYKPIPSYLIGWDFPYNPAQLNTNTVSAVDTGPNGSYYAWDQTIVFQTVTSLVDITRSADQSLELTATNTGQIALIQYLDQATARDLLNGRLSVMVKGESSVALPGKATLWYSTNASLPTITADNSSGPYSSIVTSLDSTGFPTLVSGWVQVARSGLGDAVFTLGVDTTLQPLAGWQDLTGGSSTATYFAIVVGTTAITNAQTINFNSISLVPGDVPTIPAPKSVNEVIRDCQRYYEKSYAFQTMPGTTTQNNMCLALQNVCQQVIINGTNYQIWFSIAAFQLTYIQPKRVRVPQITFYSPNDGSSGNLFFIYESEGQSGHASIPVTNWSSSRVGYDRALLIPINSNLGAFQTTQLGPNTMGSCYIEYHYVVDARLGVV